MTGIRVAKLENPIGRKWAWLSVAVALVTAISTLSVAGASRTPGIAGTHSQFSMAAGGNNTPSPGGTVWSPSQGPLTPGVNIYLDRAATGGTTNGNSVTATLTTYYSGDLLVLLVVVNSQPTSFSCRDGASLTWHQRVAVTSSPGPSDYEMYAVATNALSSDAITCTVSPGGVNLAMNAIGIHNANTVTPFDPIVPPVTKHGQGTVPTLTVSTSSPDFIVGLFGAYGLNSETAGSGLSMIATQLQPPTAASEYETRTPGSYQVSISQPTTNYWTFIGDAIMAAGYWSWAEYPPYPSGFSALSPYSGSGCGSNGVPVSPTDYPSTGQGVASVNSNAIGCGVYQTGFDFGFWGGGFTPGQTGYYTIWYNWQVTWAGVITTSLCGVGSNNAQLDFEVDSNLYVDNTNSWALGNNNVWTIQNVNFFCGLGWSWSGTQTVTPSFSAYLIAGDTYTFYSYLYGDTVAGALGLSSAFSSINVGNNGNNADLLSAGFN